MRERLQKVLAQRGVASRRHAANMILEGRVSVNGQIVLEPGMRFEPESDAIAVDGVPLSASPEEVRTLMLNKPPGYICSTADRQGKTVFSLLADVPERVVPVGRLDRESRGLLLLTNDGDLLNRLTHPSFGHRKLYRVTVTGRVDEEVLSRLCAPMMVDDYRTVPAKVWSGGGDVLWFELREGRNRQIRRMCGHVGLTVKDLQRTAVGALKLGGLPEGNWRELSRDEVSIAIET